jgi:hypothetical protein
LIGFVSFWEYAFMIGVILKMDIIVNAKNAVLDRNGKWRICHLTLQDGQQKDEYGQKECPQLKK